jgi:hypothetical protein
MNILGVYPWKKVTKFDVGAWILAQPHDNPLTSRRTGHKLETYFKGPYEVLARKDANTYVLKDVVQDKTIERHVTSLRPFYFDKQYTNPVEVARFDNFFFLQTVIVTHVCKDG